MDQELIDMQVKGKENIFTIKKYKLYYIQLNFKLWNISFHFLMKCVPGLGSALTAKDTLLLQTNVEAGKCSSKDTAMIST